jgi:signal transduction histidine kinase
LTAQDAERSRIARELHDDIGQQAALLENDLQQLSETGPEREADANRIAHAAVKRAQGISKSMRDLSHGLHPTSLRTMGLVAALNGLRREFSRSGVGVTFSQENVPTDLPDDLSLCLYRVAQEAVRNGVKHSGAHNVVVHLKGAPSALILSIADDGIGFDVDAARGKGLGLVSMNERIESLGGTLKIRSGSGTALEATVPFCAAETHAVAP